MKSNQEIFNFVALALIQQGKPSIDPAIVMCMYRSKDGCKCAAGWLIPDDKYDPKMERTIIAAVIDWYGLEDLRPYTQLIDSLQHAHDNAAVTYNSNTSEYIINPNWLLGWKDNMLRVALRYGLAASVLDS